MMRKTFLFTLLLFSHHCLALAEPFPGSYEKDVHFYQGSLESLFRLSGEELTLFFYGEAIRTKLGVFTVKLSKRWKTIVLLLANPVSLKAHGDDKVINYHTMLLKDVAHSYECQAYNDADDGSLQWRITKIQLPQSFKDSEKDRCVIPLNTVIIPVPASYFLLNEKSHVVFEKPAVERVKSIYLLPEPKPDEQTNQSVLKKDLAASHVVLMNLRPLHPKQHIDTVRHDQLQVSQIR